MAIFKTCFSTCALLLTLTILETGNFIESPSQVLPEHQEEESCIPHTRGKRSALLAQVEYDVDVELNFTDIGAVDALRSILDAGGFSLALGPTVNVTHINITTVCYPKGTHFQCRCEEHIPTTGQYCVPQTVPLVFYEYQIIIEVNTSDADQLRNVLNSLTFPVQISSSVTILDANITTVCSQDNTGFQCHCENDYLWPCDKCDTYGKCDGNTSNTCGCINAIPPDGQYCQPADQNIQLVLNNSITNNSTTNNSPFNNSITNNSITNNSPFNNSITNNSPSTTPSPTTLPSTTPSPTTPSPTTPSPPTLPSTTPSPPTLPSTLHHHQLFLQQLHHHQLFLQQLHH
ncbi:hypothetical protein KUCAC02_013386 [Chaenocephalus aceratus]|nr:hypothetical protein KUCAC02_013386 [Chaenocephalus aceratus]